MRFAVLMLIFTLMIAVPVLMAQNNSKQQVTTQDGTQVTTTITPGFLEFPWGQLLAFLGCISLIQGLIVRLIIKPAVRGANAEQMKEMKEQFPSLDSFRAHEKADKEFQDRIDEWIRDFKGRY